MSLNSPLGCQISLNKIKVLNFVPFASTQTIQLNLVGIVNPISAGSKSFALRLTDSLENDIEMLSSPISIFDKLFVPYSIKPSVSPFPNNAQINARYVFKLTPSFLIPKYSKIKIGLYH